MLSKILNRKKPNGPGSYKLLLWGPTYDTLTQYFYEWLGDLPIDGIPLERLDRRFGKITRNDIQKSLENSSSMRTLAIFAGYGTVDALLGPPGGIDDDVTQDKKQHSVIYDVGMVRNGPDTLFAFCSNSGKQLGQRFASTPGKAFLGYIGGIGFYTMEKECSDRWRYILREIAVQLADSLKVAEQPISEEHKERLIKLYDKEYEYFWKGEGKKSKGRIPMLAYLNDHRNCLRLIKRDSALAAKS